MFAKSNVITSVYEDEIISRVCQYDRGTGISSEYKNADVILWATEPMIRAYEQNKQDISKAESAAVFNLASVLGCSPYSLLG